MKKPGTRRAIVLLIGLFLVVHIHFEPGAVAVAIVITNPAGRFAADQSNRHPQQHQQ